MDTAAFDRLDSLIENNLITRHTWRENLHGRETACLLAALSPVCGLNSSASYCPADLMPSWMAHLTPWINDAGSFGEWQKVIRRYAAVARRWHVLTPDCWERLRYRMQALCIREAMRYTCGNYMEDIERVAILCESAANGIEIDCSKLLKAHDNISSVWSLDVGVRTAYIVIVRLIGDSKIILKPLSIPIQSAYNMAAYVGSGPSIVLSVVRSTFKTARATVHDIDCFIDTLLTSVERACDDSERKLVASAN